MSEFFIVLSRPPEEFETLGEALAQKATLQRHVPDVEHKVYRCKRSLMSAEHFPKMVDLLDDIQTNGLTDENRDRLRLLLLTIGNRTPNLKTLRRVSGPPEFSPRGQQ